MDTLFQNKYRIESTRLKNWDYSSHGAYFITICTRNRKCVLGEIVNGKIQLSKIGETIQKYWLEIPEHFKNVVLDEFVIMPNHLHGIVVIQNVMSNVETCHGMSLQKCNRFSKPISNSLSMIMNHFKSVVKRQCNKNGNEYFQWQSRFYEHVVRNESELNRIREYIMNNPIQWKFDKNNPKK